MKRLILRGISIGLMLSFMCSATALAASPRREAMTSENVTSRLLPENVTEADSSLKPMPKGMALAESLVSISNQGGGIIGIVASSAFYRTASWGKLTISLDVLTDAGNWKCVDIYEFEFTPEEQLDGELTSMTVGLLIDNQPANHYYRLRGMHEVEFIRDDGILDWEGHTTFTDGIKITKYP